MVFSDPENIKSGFVIEIGHFFDKKPIIGTLADINIWDRVLDTEEMEKFTDCMDVISGRGNLINEDFDFEMTGKLVTEIDIPAHEISCRKTSSILYMAVPMPNNFKADIFCNKIDLDSMAPKLESTQDFLDFHTAVNKLSSFRSRCWFGGRILTLVPYIKKSGKDYFEHLNDGSKTEFESFDEWYIHPPLEKEKCLLGYLGPVVLAWNNSLSLSC